MDCAAYQRWFSSYVDEQLAPPQRAELETHLAGCARCHAELASLQHMVQTLRTIEPPEAPNLVPRVHAALERSAANASAPRQINWWPVHGVALVTGAALIAIVVGVPRELRQPMPLRAKRGQLAAVAGAMSPSSRMGVREEERADLMPQRTLLANKERASYQMDAVSVQFSGAAQEDRLPLYTDGSELTAEEDAPLRAGAMAGRAAPSSTLLAKTASPTSLSVDESIGASRGADSGALQFDRAAVAGLTVSGTPAERKVRVPPNAVPITWHVASVDATTARLKAWLPTVQGALAAADENHLILQVPATQYAALLELLAHDGTAVSAPPAAPALPGDQPIAVNLLLTTTP